MMEEHNCRIMISVLGEYVDGTLGAELCADLERHLATCPNCRVVVNTLRKTVEIIQETSADEAMPQEARQRLFARLDLMEYLPKPPGAEPERSMLHIRPGEPCPQCRIGVMDYDGMLSLVCPVCGFGEGGCFT
ncbi:MAG TPA: zf-HC2 domain-containing protein [Anaerolineaceae bacterium]|jgi:anti-sigma factor (TIGR02949 family)|nr:zf-HC2 domain-containing protein [Anaerolineaceae bacterium]HOD45008.1 zf-HC2 domain-containing protein [Anaerolineaceae bacterium]HOH18974.1 zf-HC2 domain-containing protein [Anaerolineaceae bacterium]HQF45278.1 zf-HC2 domain-containing protein [Anaerolineaceae bacterium]HQL39897.1 zf-HC2 domain-containing protein [Anaerolineaceae bacterium]